MPPADAARAIRADHMNGSREQRYADIAYNLIVGVEADGSITVVEGRSPKNRGSHTFGMNDGTFSVCVVGDFTEQAPSDGLLTATMAATGLALVRYGIDPTRPTTFSLPVTPPTDPRKRATGPMFKKDVPAITFAYGCSVLSAGRVRLPGTAQRCDRSHS